MRLWTRWFGSTAERVALAVRERAAGLVRDLANETIEAAAVGGVGAAAAIARGVGAQLNPAA